MPRPRATDKETALMEAAVTLFLEKGISGTTIKQIAEKADVAVGTFYVYYKDKVAMIRAVAYAFADQHSALSQNVLEQHADPLEQLRAYLLGLYDMWQPFGSNSKGPLEIAKAVLKHASETLQIAQKQFLDTVETILIEAKEQNFAVTDPKTEARWIAIACSAFFPLAGTPSERPFAAELDRENLEGLIDWLGGLLSPGTE